MTLRVPYHCRVWEDVVGRVRGNHSPTRSPEEFTMSKRARKRRSRKGKAANHGKKPNA